MFGYVGPLKSELKVRELTLYQAWYCGLCKTLQKEFGQIPRLALDYDCTFLALLLAAAQGKGEPCRLARCGYKPFQKKAPVAPFHEALSYAADMNVLLYYYKVADDWRDERKISALTVQTALRPARNKAKRRRIEIAESIERGIASLSEMEAAGETSIDRVADAFAGILRDMVGQYPFLHTTQREALRWLGYHLGRWIYFMDAWEDREKDQKAGAYNPFLVNRADKERASYLLYAALNEMEKAYDVLEIHDHKGVLDNIIYLGCRHKTKRLLEGENG